MSVLNVLETELEKLLVNIKSGNSNLGEEEQKELIEFIRLLTSPYLSATESAEYIGKSRKTFDNYVKNGYIPEGKKHGGLKEKTWLKCDLDKWKLETKMKS